jgi:hypothetical protein
MFAVVPDDKALGPSPSSLNVDERAIVGMPVCA